ncbi:MAG: methyltransferase domain-containing protein [Chitinivibrionales bacterium]|nr:methyltransferase domain-containing protein [Chitinivibrionales bacterium]
MQGRRRMRRPPANARGAQDACRACATVPALVLLSASDKNTVVRQSRPTADNLYWASWFTAPGVTLFREGPMYYEHFAKHRCTRVGGGMVLALFRKLSRWAAMDTSPNPRVLEIGLGRGVFARCLQERFGEGLRYTAIEPNATLRRTGIDAGLRVVDGLVPPLPPELAGETYDLVIMSHLLEHLMNYREALQLLGEIRNRLTPDGALLLFYPDYLDYGADYFDVDYSHELILTKARVRDLLDDCGFDIVREEGLRACFHRLGLFGWLLSRGIDALTGPLWQSTGRKVFRKAKITFKRNQLAIARPRAEQ